MDLLRILARRSFVEVVVHGREFEDRGHAVVLHCKPLILLLPTHTIASLEEGDVASIVIDGHAYGNEDVKLLKSSILSMDHLSVIQVRKARTNCFCPIKLSRKSVLLARNDEITVRTLDGGKTVESHGLIVDVSSRGPDSSALCTVGTSPGDSGSPLLKGGKLAGIVMGRQGNGDMSRKNESLGVAIPIGEESLAELWRLRRHGTRWLVLRVSFLLLVAMCIPLAAISFSWASFQIAGVEVSDDSTVVRVNNVHGITLHQEWEKSFKNPVKRILEFAEDVDASSNRVAVGTWFQDGVSGAVTVLDRLGRRLWDYSIPDGECIYGTQTQSYNGYNVGRLYSYDFTEDGRNELVVAFMHNTWFPCKVMVFSPDGDVLAEYWHDGYVRTIFGAKIPGRDRPMLIISASNNRLNLDVSWHAQTIFAFEWPNISGQSPPYNGNYPQGTELWYYQIDDVDPELIRAKCTRFDLMDYDSDGVPEIRASLTDGRFYFLDADGVVRGAQLADRFIRDFGDASPPPLKLIPLRGAVSPEIGGAGGAAPIGAGQYLTDALYPITVLRNPGDVESETLIVDGFSDESRPYDTEWVVYSSGDAEGRFVDVPLEKAEGIQLSIGNGLQVDYAEMTFCEPFDAWEFEGIEFVLRSNSACEFVVEVSCIDSAIPGACQEERIKICGLSRTSLPAREGITRYRIPFVCLGGATKPNSVIVLTDPTLTRDSIVGVRITPVGEKGSITIERVGFYEGS